MEQGLVRIALVVFAIACGPLRAATLGDPGHYGVVVDADSGRPIPDAKVGAVWTAGWSSLGHGGSRCVKIMVMDADTEGRFFLPAWKRTDTDVNSLHLAVYAHKPGHRESRSASIGGRKTRTNWPSGAGGMEIVAGDLKIEMKRDAGTGEERALYLVQLALASKCSTDGKADNGAHYYFVKALSDEAMTIPPLTPKGYKVTHVEAMRRVLGSAWRDLARESPGEAARFGDPDPPPKRSQRDIAIPPPNAPAQSGRAPSRQ